MSESNTTMTNDINDGLKKYSLIEMVLHVIGNGLAAISGYTQLLERSISAQVTAISSIEEDSTQPQYESWVLYLQIIRQREALLKDFLVQLRLFSPEKTTGQFYQCAIRTDLVFLLKRTIERIAFLHQDRTIQTHLPTQTLYIMCDLLWIELLFEHIITHILSAHTSSTPVVIELKRVENLSRTHQEARITMRFKGDFIRKILETEEQVTTESQLFEAREQSLCIAMCSEILREHGGHMWYEQTAEEEELLSLALPLTV